MKKKVLCLVLTLFLVSLASYNLSAQNYDPLSPDIEWKPLLEQKQVTILYAIGKCDATDKLFLKVTNMNSGFAVTHFMLTTNQSTISIPVLLSIESRQELDINCVNQFQIPELLTFEISSASSFTCAASEVKIDLYP
ncbi:hypothetical protein [Lutimonas zeaxanthinifaciens]|uniref:hypothetical protein n=1 Tax=Lutimonas zeaxanthinifaciens TaxID=3060215 RepID=UPI00265D34CF|nr:hypothetical protein [Lutimonas sp. YSD2104]WKK66355.1 hypothetical protein QZH61_01745 [Lutimonas sp. YSD2104]